MATPYPHESTPISHHTDMPTRLSRSSIVRGESLSPIASRRDLVSVVPPTDPRVRWIFFALGASVLLPWNVLITATPYFLSRLEGSAFQPAFNSYLSVTFTFTNFAFLAHATKSSNIASASTRIRKSMIIIASLLFLLALSPLLPFRGGFFFTFTIANGVLHACAGSYLQTAVVGIAALFGPLALQSTFTGQAAVGVVVSAAQYLSAALAVHKSGAASLPDDTESDGSLSLSAFLFFGLATVYIILALFAHAILLRLPAYHAVVKPIEDGKQLLAEEEVLGPDTEEGFENEPFLTGSIELRVSGSASVWEVAKMNAWYNAAVSYVFIVTLSVFPPITSSILSVHTGSSYAIFSPVLFVSFHFLTFNVGDWFGRFLCSYPKLLMWSPRRLAFFSTLRTLFIFLFLACNVSRPTPADSLLATTLAQTPIINSDFLYLLILLSFGISNGYLSSMCMMSASSLDNNERLKKEQVDVAATVAQFCLIGGLFIGSMMSFGVRAVICDCNPFYG